MEHLARARRIAHLLDSQFKIGPFRFGLDPILGLFPGAGDTLAVLLALYVVWIAYDMRVPGSILGRMLGNVAIDYIIGIIPVVGDLADFGMKPSQRNLALLENHLKQRQS